MNFQNTQVRSKMQDVEEVDSEEVTSSNERDAKTTRKTSLKSKSRREEKTSQTNLSSPLDRPTTDRKTPLKMSTSSQSQTSPTNSPKSSRWALGIIIEAHMYKQYKQSD